jgi:hypothetical protein
MNGTPKGVWDATAGFGNINAVNAINAVDVLRVASTNPANGSTVTVTPGTITVNFNKPVNFSTVLADPNVSDILTFVATPAPDISVKLGTPIAVDNPTFPTVIQFPFSFNKPVGTLANGTYSFTVQSPPSPFGPITSKDGKDLVASGLITFNLADVTSPQVASTSTFARFVTITFTEAIDPATITLGNIYVSKDGTFLNSFPGAKISSKLNSAGQTVVTLDYSALPQTAMGNGDYKIVVNGTVTDLVGNELDGLFNGSFPSGSGMPGTAFIQDLGVLTVQAPVITAFTMTPGTDSGIPGDQNTNNPRPTFVGQVFNSFPGAISGLDVYVEFTGLHPALNGIPDLGVGSGGRGITGSFDLHVNTDASGAFTIPVSAISGSPVLPEGFQRAQAVVVGQTDAGGAGLASSQSHAFRTDYTKPTVTAARLTATSPILPTPPSTTPLSSLQTLTLFVQDQVNPTTSFLATPSQLVFPAIDPATAVNVSNFSLTLVNPNGTTTNESQFINTATYVPLASLVSGSVITAYEGQINLTFLSGLPAGNYKFAANATKPGFPGLLDAAGNSIAADYTLNFAIQSQPVFITNLVMQNSGGVTIGGPRSYYELPSSVPGYVPRATAPPTMWAINLSNPLPFVSAGFYDNKVQLIGSANTFGGTPDGNFGDLGVGGLGSTDPASGFSIVPGTHVTLYYQDSSGIHPADATHPGTWLWMTLPSGTTLPADYYRVYVPNQLELPPGGLPAVDTRIFDVFGNQLDGEFLGNPTANGSYQDLLNTGVVRNNDMSGDGIAGGAFTTGFVVVPAATQAADGSIRSNIVFARPDYQEDPLLPSTAPDGSLAKPYSALAPEGDPTTAPANLGHDPNGGLNSSQFFLSGFNPIYDRNGNGRFDRSALYAASQLAYRGPVVVVALPGTPQRDPLTGVISQQTFVLQAPSGGDAVINNGSASVPFDTTLVFTAGSTLKAQNASLLVQNQGSAIEALGSQINPVNFTSYANDSVGGDTNQDGSNTTPAPGDWGGVLLRNFDQATHPSQTFPVDGTLQGINGPAISGADDAMSTFNFTDVSYAGGSVPLTQGTRYDAIDLYNSRPAITNDVISFTGGKTGTVSTQAAIAADLNSFREDDTARGPLVRATTLQNNSLNGIWVRPESIGIAEASDAMSYPGNPTTWAAA